MFHVGLYNLTACCYLLTLGMTTTKKGLDSQFKPSFTSKILFTRLESIAYNSTEQESRYRIVLLIGTPLIFCVLQTFRVKSCGCTPCLFPGPVPYSTPPCREHTLKGKNAQIYSTLRPNEFMDYAGGQGP